MNERPRRSTRTVTPSHFRKGLAEQASAPPTYLPPNLRRSRAERFGSRFLVLIQVAIFIAAVVIPAAAIARSSTSGPAPAAEASPSDGGGTRGDSAKTPVEKPTATPKATTKPTTTRTTPNKTTKSTSKSVKPATTRGSTKTTTTTTTPTTEGTVTTAAVGEPTIVSDKADYAPGETVTLTGEN
jgi:cytoskeletal protein RodZ